MLLQLIHCVENLIRNCAISSAALPAILRSEVFTLAATVDSTLFNTVYLLCYCNIQTIITL